MATVFDSLSLWLADILKPANGFEGRFIVDVEVVPEHAGVENTALFSNPNDIHTQLLGGQMRHEEYKTFYVRRDFTNTQARMNNEVFFETLRKSIHLKNLRGDYPVDDRKWLSISYEGGIIPSNKSNDFAIYQVNLKLRYIE